MPSQCLADSDSDIECSMILWSHGCGGNHNKASRKPPSLDQTQVLYADTNNIVLLQPAILRNDKGNGIWNNITETFPNSYEIERGCWDGYGQLGEDYALQSGVHNRNIWNMIKELAGSDYEAKQSEECIPNCQG